MEEKFLEAFKEALEIEGHEVQLSDTFRDFDEWSSLGQLSLIAMLDDEYDVVIENAVFDKLQTVGDLLQEVKKRRSN